ncbi:MAG: hypothetical protein HY822_23385 [Acidobacteria bacterium]|nr:hypothetical protein [Acidobacteriota bacterium]
MSIKVQRRAAPAHLAAVRWADCGTPRPPVCREPAREEDGPGAATAGGVPEAEAERRCEEAYRRGAAEARRQLEAETRARAEPLLERLAGSLASIAALRARIRTETEAEVVRLAVAIARRVLHRELTLDPDAIQGLVKAALQKLQAREIQRVRLHSGQQAFVRETLSRLVPSGALEVVVDPGLQPGDVIFETAQGDLDASIDTQLREIERGFADRLEA